MVWGLFDGLGPLGALEERVTANYYKVVIIINWTLVDLPTPQSSPPYT